MKNTFFNVFKNVLFITVTKKLKKKLFPSNFFGNYKSILSYYTFLKSEIKKTKSKK